MICIRASKLRDGQRCLHGGVWCVCTGHYEDGSARLTVVEGQPDLIGPDGQVLREGVRVGDVLAVVSSRAVGVQESIAPTYGAQLSGSFTASDALGAGHRGGLSAKRRVRA